MDFEASAHQNRVVIKFGICDELDKLNERTSNVPEVMSRVAEHELQELPEFVESCSMVYIAEMGYFLTIPFWDTNLTDEQLKSLPNLQYKFKTEDVVYYKSARCCELDNLLGDITMKILEMESKIVLKLVQYIQRNISPLIKLTGLIVELDCLLALAQVARDYNLVQPILVTDKQIHIINGRHMLQELCVDIFVPNNTHSSEEHGFVKILTGPNASGKSVYLKQVALIVYLAQVGSYVPAEQATISIVDQIHTRIQTMESVTTNLSAFMVDLRQMALSIRNSTTNSLILVDEFGKGTSEVDGLAILVACLECFIAKENNTPHLFVSTHFHSLPKMLPPSPIVKLQHLEHIVEKGELIYLYRLKDGAVQASFALQVAETHDLAKSSSERVCKILNGLREAQEVTADRSNKLVEVTEKRRSFLRKLSEANLDADDGLDKMKKNVLSLRL